MRGVPGLAKVLPALKGLFHTACLACVVSWFAFVIAIFMANKIGDKQMPAKRRQVQGMLGETDPSTNKFRFTSSVSSFGYHPLCPLLLVTRMTIPYKIHVGTILFLRNSLTFSVIHGA